MVTHDFDEAILLSDKIALMTSRTEMRLAEIIKVNVRHAQPGTVIEQPDSPRGSESMWFAS